MFETIQIDNVEELKQENICLKDRIKTLEDRLEYNSSYPNLDGIFCRDETIKAQDDWIDKQTRKINQLQARIDELMFEYCPEEMTEEQLENYRKSVGVVDEQLP